MKSIIKIVLVAASVLIVGAVVFLAWGRLTRTGTPPAVPDGAPALSVPAGLIPSPFEQGGAATTTLERISDRPVFDFWIVPETRAVYYLTPRGEVHQAEQGADTPVSQQALGPLTRVETSPKRDRVLASFGDPQAPSWGVFDVIDGVWRPLPREILTATWNNTGDTLIGIMETGGGRTLVTIDLTAAPAAPKTVMGGFAFNDVRLMRHATDTLFVIERASARVDGRVWELNTKTLNFSLLFTPESGLLFEHSDDGAFFFKSTASGFSILTPALQETAPVFFSTPPSKCTAYSEIVFCFVPGNIPPAVTLPDDYLMRAYYSVDELYKISTANGDIQKLFSSNTSALPPLDGIHPRVSDDKMLYFINRYDGLLYRTRI